MGKIIELSEHVANQIAAGEVVERPAAVIKELVENSLDAGAKNIEVHISEGGLSFMVVKDDGAGMDEDDVQLAIKRYATSKLSQTCDLFSINSFGFRGEALPSIASVANMSIYSRPAQNDFAYLAKISGGKIIEAGKASGHLGTRVEVRDLFFNVPARLKFVKSKRSETAKIDKLLRACAYISPDVAWKFFNENKLLFSLTKSEPQSFERAQALLGRETAGLLYFFEQKTELLSISGALCAPMLTRRDTDGIHIFVNNRLVADKKLVGAIKASFRTLLEIGRNPIIAIMINIAPNLVDINVHPQKSAVRFMDERRVLSHIISLLTEFLSKTPWLRQDAPKQELATESSELKLYCDYKVEAKEPEEWPVFTTSPQRLLPTHKFADLRVIGQVQSTYLLLASPDGLVIMDQHAAHERIRFEEIKKQKEQSLSTQPLLIPIVMSIDKSQVAAFFDHQKDLAKLGIDAEIFGEESIVVRALPDFMASQDVKSLMRDILSEFVTMGQAHKQNEIYDHICATLACHSSIRAGQKMSIEEMQALLIQLDSIEYGAHCPHGRPVVKSFSASEIKKWFDRT